MRIKIGHRLFVGFLLTALLVLALSSGLTRWSFQRGFLNYINDSEADRLQYLSFTLAQVYGEAESWEPLKGDADRWVQLMGPPAPETAPGAPARPLGRARDGGVVSEDPLAISPRITVLDKDGGRLFGPPAGEIPQRLEAIVHRGQVVGSLHLNPLLTLANDLDVSFSEQQTRWIYGTALVAFLLAGLLAMIFTRQMVSPIGELAKGTRSLAAGDFAERINVQSTAELGDLAKDFNTLAETLERNQHAQQQWIADISHELRTPLSILRGELQAVEDGVRAFNETTRNSLSAEVEHLTKLVNDIYELSVSDVGALRYQKEIGDVVDVLRETVELFEARVLDAGLELQVSYPSEPLNALIDDSRLSQLFTNVLENSVRYTDRGGMIRVSCVKSETIIQVNIEDSAPSVPEDGLPQLFKRLYRVESSRGRSTGGAGLGLAICENIAHAHGGDIRSTRSELGGVNIQIQLPAADTQEIRKRRTPVP